MIARIVAWFRRHVIGQEPASLNVPSVLDLLDRRSTP